MTEQTKLELIKSFAYGATAEDITAVGRMELEDTKKFLEENKEEIEKKKAELKEGGWND